MVQAKLFNMRVFILLIVACINGNHDHIIETNEFQKLRKFFNVDKEYDAEVLKQPFEQQTWGLSASVYG